MEEDKNAAERRTEPLEIAVALPWPPSTNHLWRFPTKGLLRGRALLTARAREYKANARAIIEALELEPIAGRVEVALVAYPPNRLRRDLDNLVKIVLDSLKGAAFGDDSEVYRLCIERGPVEKGGLIRAYIRPLGAWATLPRDDLADVLETLTVCYAWADEEHRPALVAAVEKVAPAVRSSGFFMKLPSPQN